MLYHHLLALINIDNDPNTSSGLEQTIDDIILVSVILAALAGIGKALQVGCRFVRRISYFLNDWYGEDARPGQDARPGIVSQVAEIKKSQQDISETVREQGLTLMEIRERQTTTVSDITDIKKKVEYELSDNTGNSVKDFAKKAASNIDRDNEDRT